jgi:hypothetical protein
MLKLSRRPSMPGSGRVRGSQTCSRHTTMRKLAIALMLVAGVVLSGSVIAATAPAPATGHHAVVAKKSTTKHHQKKTHHKAAKTAKA